MLLYHFSERSDIDTFRPRQKSNRRDMPPVVWAIDEFHQPSFFVPRDCPRIVIYRTADMTPKQQQTFFSGSHADTIVIVPTAWFHRLATATIYRYTFVSSRFELFDSIAGYYISYHEEVPVALDPLTNLPEHILDSGAELRVTPDLHPVRDLVLTSGICSFGIHRFENNV